MTHFSAENKIDFDKNFNSLIYNLSPTFAKNISPKIFEGKLETFLTCRALSAYLKENGLDETAGNLFEELALNAIYKTLFTNLSVADVKLLIAELPSLLQLKYPVVKNILEISLKLIEQIKIFYSGAYSGDDFYRSQIYSKFEYIERLLSAFNKS